MSERFIFTVATGRCGQASLTELINRHVPDAFAAFEEPQVRLRLPRVLGDLERHFRRTFIQTDELLGRGRILTAYTAGNDGYIARVSAQRLSQIRRMMARKGKSIYVDVSKYYARGLHIGFSRHIPRFGLILLVRDPVKNMRSFLNRKKYFFKDNPPTEAPRNFLRFDSGVLDVGELYLWAWCEMYLRYLAIRDSGQATHAVVIRTDDLTQNEKIADHFRALDLPFEPLTSVPVMNSNVGSGNEATVVTKADVETFERFVNRLPPAALDRIDYLKTYRPPAVF